MRIHKLAALVLVAGVFGLAGCNDKNTPRTPAGTAPPVPPVVTVGSFATDQVKTVTCVNNNTVDVNAVTFTDSEDAVDVEGLDPACMGGPAS